MNEETHFTNKDRDTLASLFQSSVIVETKLDRVIKDVADLNNNTVRREEHNDLERRVSGVEGNLSKATWIVLSVVMVAVLSFVVVSYKL